MKTEFHKPTKEGIKGKMGLFIGGFATGLVVGIVGTIVFFVFILKEISNWTPRL